MKDYLSASEKKLLAAALEGGEAEWNALFAKYKREIWKLIRWRKWRFTKEEQLDVFQNTHIHLQKALHDFRQESSLLWYIKRVTMNECVNETRRRTRRQRAFTPPVQQASDGSWDELQLADPDALDPGHATFRLERAETVRSVICGLDKTCQRSITLRYYEDLSYGEIAKRLGVSTKTVGSRLTKCRDKLRELFLRTPALNEECS